MKIALVSVPVPEVPLSIIQRHYYFYFFAARVFSIYSHLTAEDFQRFYMQETPHLGLLSLIAWLEQNNIECSYFAPICPPNKNIKINREQILLDKILNRIDKFNIIGLSCITAAYPTALKYAQIIKKEYPDKIVMLGGAHAWTRDIEILNPITSPFDIIIRKEGELTTLELLQALENKKPLDNIKGITYKHNGQIYRNKERPRMDRSILPIPAYNHLEDNFTKEELNGEDKIYLPLARVTPNTGCSNRCVWCADYWKPETTYQNLTKFQEEIKLLVNQRGTKTLYIGTHDFLYDIERAKDIADAIAELKLSIYWEAQTRITDKFTKDLAIYFKECNCNCIQGGVESGDDNMLRVMNKNITIKLAAQFFNNAKTGGLYTHAYWITGVPNETIETAKKSIKLIAEEMKRDNKERSI